MNSNGLDTSELLGLEWGGMYAGSIYGSISIVNDRRRHHFPMIMMPHLCTKALSDMSILSQ
ncbi:hypothetical protein BO86DRAFT_393984 [Aspergillus japonicus CBS 114.51]|uniref:Uncharacterized protein n=1 Tax=Aspergillus japonicus CBS 114.51 TaxID=1448312 RepID=A0A8T8WJ20_ASPJA|nr:hypothetical protein BO86DRAFT_393984 [Aspergillus japonicus CBS 114.51]RAH75775.1 hypothetical protein BO86DRAFT_393984 [Aspergillus japonicus CBS 114.51]